MIELAFGIVGSILTIVLTVLRLWEHRKKKTLVDTIEDKKREVDLYISNKRFDQAAYVAYDALSRIDLFLRAKGKNPPGG